MRLDDKALLIGLAIIFGIVGLFGITVKAGTELVEKVSAPAAKIAKFELPNILVAKSAVVYDIVENKFIYTLNADAPLPAASLTKLMTAYVANKILDSKDEITISRENLMPEGDNGLVIGEKFSPSQLTAIALVASSNDAASALGDSASVKDGKNSFPSIMNKESLALGLSNSFFTNETGLDISKTTGGSYTSAKDVALLIRTILEKSPNLLFQTRNTNVSITSNSGKIHNISNTNKGVASISGIVGSKTGLTELAGGNLAVAFEAGPGRPIIVAVLGSSEEGRFSDVRNLIDGYYNYLGQIQ